MSDDVIQACNLSKVFQLEGTDVNAFTDISLSIARSQMVAIMGPSGSGKSTLLHVMGGIEPPTSGDIRIDGANVADLDDQTLTLLRRRKIGFVFQSFNLVPTLSVIENVTLPLVLDGVSAREAEPRAILQLERVGLSHRLRHLPSQLYLSIICCNATFF